LLLSWKLIRNVKSRRMRWTGHIECISDKRNSYRILEGKQEGKRSLGRLRERRNKLDFSVSGYRRSGSLF
jgi:hypothetical protein